MNMRGFDDIQTMVALATDRGRSELPRQARMEPWGKSGGQQEIREDEPRPNDFLNGAIELVVPCTTARRELRLACSWSVGSNSQPLPTPPAAQPHEELH